MQVSVSGLRRNIKNIAHNYTEPQKKVREATSNDPWGAPSTLMSEIADLTYNIEAFAQIMEMLWKRLNDHGKNWRHVYKSLVLIEYLIKTGSERVAQQCKENIFAIQTLKDFQYFEDNKDQGLNVREKAKQLVTLLSSEERLRNERARALKARERFAQTVSGFGSSDSNDTTPTSPVFTSNHFGGSEAIGAHGAAPGTYTRHRSNSELENARPQTVGEEELQLQLALAMSKEEAEQEEKRRRSDDIRLQMALSQSEQEFQAVTPPPKNESALVDLLDVDLGGAAALPPVGGVPVLPGGDSHMTALQGATLADLSMRSAFRDGDPWAPLKLSGPGPVNHQPDWSSSASSSTFTSPQDPWNSQPTSSIVAGPSVVPRTTFTANNDPWLTSTTTSPPFVISKPDPWLSSTTTVPPLTIDKPNPFLPPTTTMTTLPSLAAVEKPDPWQPNRTTPSKRPTGGDSDFDFIRL